MRRLTAVLAPLSGSAVATMAAAAVTLALLAAPAAHAAVTGAPGAGQTGTGQTGTGQTSTGQTATGKHSSRPTTGTLNVSKATLGHLGGKIALTTMARHATHCIFSSSPKVTGLPATVSCSHGRASRTVRLPANAGTKAVTYRFKVIASGPGGRSKPRYASVGVLPAAPTATLTAAPDGLTLAGGSATLTATVTRASSCELSVTPALAGLPEPVACQAGSTATQVSATATLPALTGSTAIPYDFSLKVTGPGGTVTRTATETVWPAMTFKAPTPADAPEGYPGSLSCASATDCVATDFFGNAVSWNGTSWSGPQRILALPAGLTTPMQTAVSCPATSFCAAVDQSGAMAIDDDGTWSSGPAPGIAATAISCASSTFCAAVGGPEAAIYSAGTWSAPAQLPSSGGIPLQSVSCAPGTSFCMATDYEGNAYTYDGSSWSGPAAFDSRTDSEPAVSCASQDFCVAVDGGFNFSTGDAYIYDGTSWSAPQELSSSTGLTSVTCPTASYCLATTENGYDYYTLTDGSWSGPQSGIVGYVASCWAAGSCGALGSDGDAYLLTSGNWAYHPTGLRPGGFTTAVSCPTATFCAATDQTGSVAIYNGSGWKVQTPPITPPGVGLVAISCTSAKFCMAADDDGGEYGSGAYTWTGSYWSGSLPGLYLTSVSCTSATFCVALGYLNTGVFASVWNGSSWGTQTEIDSASPAAGQVSCASPDFCAAVDANGNAMIFNGQSWSSPDPIDPGVVEPLATVSCPTATFCTAMDGYGQAFTYAGGAWSAAVGVEADAGVTSVSCTSATFCAAADLSGNVVTFYNGTWSAPQNIDPQSDSNYYGFTGISCATVAFCAAVDYDGNAAVGTG